jgi:hypothetical protein
MIEFERLEKKNQKSTYDRKKKKVGCKVKIIILSAINLIRKIMFQTITRVYFFLNK